MSSRSIEVDHRDGLSVITLNRPDQENRFNTAMMQEWIAALKDVGAADPGVIVVQAAGDCFSLGRDQSEAPPAGMTKRDLLSLILDANDAFADLQGLVLAKVHGAAKGFAAGVLVQADVAIGSESASVCFDEIAHGFPPTIVMTYLEDILGPKLATSMMLTGRSLDAREASGAGIFSVVVPDSELDERTDQLITELTQLSSAAIRKGKAAMRLMRRTPAAERGGVALDLLTQGAS